MTARIGSMTALDGDRRLLRTRAIVLAALLAFCALVSGEARAGTGDPGPDVVKKSDQLVTRGTDLFKKGEISKGLALIVRGDKLNPGRLTKAKSTAWKALIEKGFTELRKQNYELSIRVLKPAVDLNPFDPSAPFYLGRCYYLLGVKNKDDGSLHKAEKVLEKVFRRDATYGAPYYLMGQVGAALGDRPRAVFGFRQALERRFHARETRVLLAVQLLLWGIQRYKVDARSTDTSIAIMQEARDRLDALKDDLRYPTVARKQYRKLWIQSLNYLAALRQTVSDLPEAERILRRLIKIQPGNYENYYNLGLLLGQAKRYKEAMAAYRKALELNKDPTWVDPYVKMGYIRSQQEKPKEALEYFHKFLAQHPDSWDGHFELGAHYGRSGEPEKAIAEYERCIELDPAKRVAMYEISRQFRLSEQNGAADAWLFIYKETASKDSGGAPSTDQPPMGQIHPGKAPGK